MPIAGMLSLLPPRSWPDSSASSRPDGRSPTGEPPYRVFKAIEGTCLACNAGPHLTDLGLTDGSTRQIVEPLIDCRKSRNTQNTTIIIREPEHGRQYPSFIHARKLAGAPFCLVFPQHAAHRMPRGHHRLLAAATCWWLSPACWRLAGWIKARQPPARFWCSSAARC